MHGGSSVLLANDQPWRKPEAEAHWQAFGKAAVSRTAEGRPFCDLGGQLFWKVARQKSPSVAKVELKGVSLELVHILRCGLFK